jgi:plastocyanin
MQLNAMTAASLTLVGWSVLSGCTGVPLGSSGLHDTSRTGKVHDISIVGNEVTPKKVVVHPGDEIRWVNHRNASVRVAFSDPLDQKLSCERNFAMMTGLRHTTKIGANDSASLCFAGPGMLIYMVRMEANIPGNESIDSGSIEVASADTSEQPGTLPEKTSDISKR